VSVQLTVRPVAATLERYAHTADTRVPLTS
jgi:hypothetical protein